PALHIQRQSLLGKPLQNLQIPASIPGTLRLHPGRQSFLPQVLPMVQHRTPPSRNRPDDAKPSPLRASRRNLRRPKADPRKRFPHQPEPLREKHPLAPRQANRRLDQSAPNYTDDGRLIYAGRVGTGMPDKVLADLRRRLEPLARTTSPLSAPPPRKTRFGSPLVLSRVHWVEPKLVAEITYLTWTGDALLRRTVYIGLRSDKPAREVRLEAPRKP